jgi:hypothetical protein
MFQTCDHDKIDYAACFTFVSQSKKANMRDPRIGRVVIDVIDVMDTASLGFRPGAFASDDPARGLDSSGHNLPPCCSDHGTARQATPMEMKYGI